MKKLLAIFFLSLSLAGFSQPVLRSTMSQFTSSLMLDFTQGTLPSSLSFTRSSTATRVSPSGLIETVAANLPRFDYDPVTLATKGLLIEESRTNLLTRSTEFDTGDWVKVNATVTPNTIVAPDGTATADLITWVNGATLNGSTYVRYWSAIGAGSNSLTCSIYLKANGVTSVRLYNSVRYDSGVPNRPFNTDTYTTYTLTGDGSFTQVGWQIDATIKYIGNGWYRCTGRYNFGIDGNGSGFGISPNQATDGVSGVYVWGAQAEPGSLATSYIPTTATAVTRAADVCTMSLGSWWRSGGSLAVLPSGAATISTNLNFNTGYTARKVRFYPQPRSAAYLSSLTN